MVLKVPEPIVNVEPEFKVVEVALSELLPRFKDESLFRVKVESALRLPILAAVVTDCEALTASAPTPPELPLIAALTVPLLRFNEEEEPIPIDPVPEIAPETIELPLMVKTEVEPASEIVEA